MQTKESRLRLIQKLLKEKSVSSQEEILAILAKEGYATTQATLSRDLKILGVAKVHNDEGGYSYIIPANLPQTDYKLAFIEDLKKAALTVAFSKNLAVIKTRIGHGNSVALALDNLELTDILGTIAGDDTVLVVLSEQTNKKSFYKKLHDFVPNLMLL